MKKRTVRAFIKEFKEELIQYIKRKHDVEVKTFKDLEEFIKNDERLYNWAKSDGVNI